jgi:ribosomal protein S6
MFSLSLVHIALAIALLSPSQTEFSLQEEVLRFLGLRVDSNQSNPQEIEDSRSISDG